MKLVYGLLALMVLISPSYAGKNDTLGKFIGTCINTGGKLDYSNGVYFCATKSGVRVSSFNPVTSKKWK